MARILLALCLGSFSSLNTQANESWWLGGNLSALYPPDSIFGVGINLGYRHYVEYQANVGMAIHTTVTGHTLGSYPVQFRIPGLSLKLAPYVGLYQGKTQGYDYNGLLDDTSTRVRGRLIGLGLMDDASRWILLVGTQYLSDDDYQRGIPMMKFCLKMKR